MDALLCSLGNNKINKLRICQKGFNPYGSIELRQMLGGNSESTLLCLGQATRLCGEQTVSDCAIFVEFSLNLLQIVEGEIRDSQNIAKYRKFFAKFEKPSDRKIPPPPALSMTGAKSMIKN